MKRHADCEHECQVAAARGAHRHCNGVCAVEDAEQYDDPPDDCPDCGAKGECLPGCPSRLP